MTPTDTELWFDYVLRPRSRVSAGKSGAVQNVRPIHTVIPGTVVRGAIGSAFWSARGGLAAEGVDSARELFDETFRRGLTVYHAVPFTKGRATGAPSAEDVVAAQVNIGTTMVRCKYEHAHLGWHDIVAQPLSRDRCPRCAGGLERGKGWTAPDPSMLPGAGGSPLTVATTRTALRPDGSSKDEQLFTRKALVTDIELRGRVRLVTADPAQAGRLQRWMAGLGELSIGGQRSTLGRCTWSMEPVAEPGRPDGGPRHPATGIARHPCRRTGRSDDRSRCGGAVRPQHRREFFRGRLRCTVGEVHDRFRLAWDGRAAEVRGTRR